MRTIRHAYRSHRGVTAFDERMLCRSGQKDSPHHCMYQRVCHRLEHWHDDVIAPRALRPADIDTQVTGCIVSFGADVSGNRVICASVVEKDAVNRPICRTVSGRNILTSLALRQRVCFAPQRPFAAGVEVCPVFRDSGTSRASSPAVKRDRPCIPPSPNGRK